MLQENLVDFNPFRGILSVSRESDRSNIPVERTVAKAPYGTCEYATHRSAQLCLTERESHCP